MALVVMVALAVVPEAATPESALTAITEVIGHLNG